MTTAAPITTAPGRGRLLALTYLRLDLKRALRNRRALGFSVVLPAVLYLVFGATTDRTADAGVGNVAFYVLVGMAVYGAIVSAASNSAAVAGEQLAGWPRTLMMTPLTPGGYVGAKVGVAMITSALPLIVLAVVAALTGAHAPVHIWISCLLIGWLGSAVFAAYGLALGSLLRTEGAMQALGLSLTLLAFAGNVFVPLQGAMLTFSQFTPMFGVVTLARYPLDGGDTVYGTHIDLWIPLLNTAVWASVFAVAAAFFYSRSTSRQ